MLWKSAFLLQNSLHLNAVLRNLQPLLLAVSMDDCANIDTKLSRIKSHTSYVEFCSEYAHMHLMLLHTTLV